MNDTSEPPDMALIWRVQQARLQHDSTAMPSEMSAVYWIEVKCPLPMPAPTPRSGEFRLMTQAGQMDADWQRIRQATLEGRLGYKSKVSTVPAHDTSDPQARTICIRTYDSADTADLARISTTLAELGFPTTIYQVDHL